MKPIILLFFLLFVISACTVPPEISQQLEETNKKILEQQQEIDYLKSKLQPVEEQKPIDVQHPKFLIDLTQWSEDEIIDALATKNPKFRNAVWFQYQYRDDGAYYDLEGPIFPVDPFYDIVYFKRNRELTINALRLFNLDPGNKEI